MIASAGMLLATSQITSTAGAQGQTAAAPAPSRTLTEADCTADRLGTAIPREAIGEPVSAVTLSVPAWTAASGAGYCAVTGTMAPMDPAPTARAITFRVVLPAAWDGRAMQLGGGGMNGVIPNLTGAIDGGPNGPARGVVTYGSDSGHQMGPNTSVDWATERRGDQEPRLHADEEDA